MDSSYMKKNIIDLSEEELITLEFLGDNAAPGIKDLVEKVRANPARLGTVTCFMVDCLKRKYAARPS